MKKGSLPPILSVREEPMEEVREFCEIRRGVSRISRERAGNTALDGSKVENGTENRSIVFVFISGEGQPGPKMIVG